MRNTLTEYLKPVQLFVTFLEVTIPSITEVNSNLGNIQGQHTIVH